MPHASLMPGAPEAVTAAEEMTEQLADLGRGHADVLKLGGVSMALAMRVNELADAGLTGEAVHPGPQLPGVVGVPVARHGDENGWATAVLTG
jgi:hypothetical protein